MDKKQHYGAVDSWDLVKYWFDNYYVPPEKTVMVEIQFAEFHKEGICIVTFEDRTEAQRSRTGYPGFKEVIKVSELAQIWIEKTERSSKMPEMRLIEWTLLEDRYHEKVLVYVAEVKGEENDG